MKKKYIKNTYLLGVSDYTLKIKKEKEGYIAVKHVKEIDKPYIETHSGKNICLLDDGYYIVEYFSPEEHYLVRVFLNDKKQIQQYYIDITKENNYNDGDPYYLDLYLDITIDVHKDNQVMVWDENELEEAKMTKDITEEDYNMAYETLKKLLNEIKENNNFWINKDHKKTVEDVLKG